MGQNPRIYTPQDLTLGSAIELEATAARHLDQVLRLRPGNHLILFNGNGHNYHARILHRERRGLRAEVLEILGPEEPLPKLRLHLVQGVAKGERMDFVVQKAVELGVQRISPVFTQRSVVRLDGERLSRRMAHWDRIVVGACEQSGRCRLAQLDRVELLPPLLDRLPHTALKLLLNHRSGGSICDLPPPANGVVILIGPEGGLTGRETEQAGRKGFTPVRLGPRVMRTETAPLAALAALQTLWGDFR